MPIRQLPPRPIRPKPTRGAENPIPKRPESKTSDSRGMKTLRISDETHRKLTATLGTLMAQKRALIAW